MEIAKCEFDAKLTTVGNGSGFIVPAGYARVFNMAKGRRYRVQIVEEIKKALFEFSTRDLLRCA